MKFEAANTAILGCSADDAEAQTKFKVKHKLNFPLLADTEFQVVEAYGARRMKSFLGKSFMGIVRMSYWIGPDGKIRKIWDKVTPKGHAAEILAAIEEGNAVAASR
jgi:thioredoxin-dependent peroxiredoxin